MFEGKPKSSNVPLETTQLKFVPYKWITEKAINESVMCRLDSKKNDLVCAFNAFTKLYQQYTLLKGLSRDNNLIRKKTTACLHYHLSALK